jgi:hypothetical protein
LTASAVASQERRCSCTNGERAKEQTLVGSARVRPGAGPRGAASGNRGGVQAARLAARAGGRGGARRKGRPACREAKAAACSRRREETGAVVLPRLETPPTARGCARAVVFLGKRDATRPGAAAALVVPGERPRGAPFEQTLLPSQRGSTSQGKEAEGVTQLARLRPAHCSLRALPCRCHNRSASGTSHRTSLDFLNLCSYCMKKPAQRLLTRLRNSQPEIACNIASSLSRRKASIRAKSVSPRGAGRVTFCSTFHQPGVPPCHEQSGRL